MTKIEKLLLKLCPEGIEFKKLGEIGVFYGGLSGKKKADFNDGNEKYITYMNVFCNPSVKLDALEYVKIVSGERQNPVKFGDVLFTGSSETLEEVGMSSVVTTEIDIPLFLNSFCFGFRLNDLTILLPEFCQYLFRSENIRKQIKQTANGVTRYNISKKKMELIRIPIPPIPVQREIVGFLDSLSMYTTDICDTLISEIGQQRLRKNFYLNTLVAPENNVTRVRFGELFDFQNGFAFKSATFKKTGKSVVRIKNIRDGCINTDDMVFVDDNDYKENLYPFIVYPGDIVIAMSGATTGKIGINKTDNLMYINQRVGKFIPHEEIVTKEYLYYLLLHNAEEIYRISIGGAQPNLSSEKLKRLNVAIPSIIEQNKIVSILTEIQSAFQSIEEELTQEINARKLQYEYYRDKMLSFQEKEK